MQLVHLPTVHKTPEITDSGNQRQNRLLAIIFPENAIKNSKDWLNLYLGSLINTVCIINSRILLGGLYLSKKLKL